MLKYPRFANLALIGNSAAYASAGLEHLIKFEPSCQIELLYKFDLQRIRIFDKLL